MSEELGVTSQERKGARGSPQSSPLTPHGEAINRIRWRCRRGLLELDLVLARFAQRHLDALSAPELEVLARLLEQPDLELWELIGGNRSSGDERLDRVLGLLREC